MSAGGNPLGPVTSVEITLAPSRAEPTDIASGVTVRGRPIGDRVEQDLAAPIAFPSSFVGAVRRGGFALHVNKIGETGAFRPRRFVIRYLR